MPKVVDEKIRRKSVASPLPTRRLGESFGRMASKNIFRMRQEGEKIYPSANEADPVRARRTTFLERRPRPVRWRGGAKKSAPEQPSPREDTQLRFSFAADDDNTVSVSSPVRESIHKLSRNPDQAIDAQTLSDQGDTRLRFSFTADDSNVTQSRSHPSRAPASSLESYNASQALNSSFTGLSFGHDTAASIFPELSNPKKQREGYGFSFSDSLFRDDDEYPDTDCEGELGREARSSNVKQKAALARKSRTATSDRPATPGHDSSYSSFSEVVVMREIGSFDVAKPPRRLACTTATREDTIRLKQATKSLLKYNESGEIYADLIGRLERMVRAALQGPASDFPTTAPTTNSCAIKLRDHLLITAYGRIVTGEDQIIVEHEVQWANWMVEASRTGVMHLKGPGCRCRSDWDEN